MSKKAYKIYTEMIRDTFKVFYANWPVGEPLKLGDYGIMDDRIFIRQGNISDDYKINVEPRIDPSSETYQLMSIDSGEIKFEAKGSGNIKATVNISFTKEDSVFFNATGIKNHSIENLKEVRNKIEDLHKKKLWSENHVVVTRLVQADLTTLIISGQSDASVTLEAESELISNINLEDASIKLKLIRKKGIEFIEVSKEGLFPLLGISGIKPKNLFSFSKSGDASFIPFAKAVYTSIYYAKNLIKEGKSSYEDELYFGEI